MTIQLDSKILESRKLTHCDKLVYAAILSFSDFRFRILNPTEGQIAERCNVCHRQVRRSLGRLVAAGIITREGRELTLTGNHEGA